MGRRGGPAEMRGILMRRWHKSQPAGEEEMTQAFITATHRSRKPLFKDRSVLLCQ